MMADKTIFVIAGPNGARRTTFATEFLRKEARRYRYLVDAWAVYDNSGPVPVLVAEENRK